MSYTAAQYVYAVQVAEQIGMPIPERPEHLRHLSDLDLYAEAYCEGMSRVEKRAFKSNLRRLKRQEARRAARR